jgi:hypothetical protein
MTSATLSADLDQAIFFCNKTHVKYKPWCNAMDNIVKLNAKAYKAFYLSPNIMFLSIALPCVVLPIVL